MSIRNQLPVQFLERLPVAACSCDRQGVITDYNDHAMELWGRAPISKDLFGGAAQLYDCNGKRLELSAWPLAFVLRSGQTRRNTELIIEKPDGARVTVLSNAAPVRNADGRFVGAVEIFQDITERRWSEDARRVADRLMASARVASDVAQQIKTPLHSMASLLEILRQDANLSAEARSYTELLKAELSRFDQLARQMVHLSMAA